MVDLTFIHSRYGASTDREEKYSSQALARSHAAKAAHKKRQSRKLNLRARTENRSTHHFLSAYEGNSDPFNATLADESDSKNPQLDHVHTRCFHT
jgi:hypothetical protein